MKSLYLCNIIFIFMSFLSHFRTFTFLYVKTKDDTRIPFNIFLFMFLLGLLKIITFRIWSVPRILGDTVQNLRARHEEVRFKIRIVFDVRHKKRAKSENQKADVSRNYIRFGKDEERWCCRKEKVHGNVFIEFESVAQDRQLQAQRSERIDAKRLSFAE